MIDPCRSASATPAMRSAQLPGGGRLALYGGFAVLAVLLNLAVQRAVMAMGEGAMIFVAAMGTGTLAGLLLKYWLDSRWIFASAPGGTQRRFGLYSATGGLTTALFWGSETLFWTIWQTETMRELGAILGLGAGYALKYELDRRFVFVPARRTRP